MTVAEKFPLRRIIVQLGHGADQRPLRFAAELAQLLSSNLHGLFIENEAVLALAKLSFARELRLPGHEWQPLDADRVMAEFRNEAALAQRLLNEAVTGLDIAGIFQVVRGDPATSLVSFAREKDVVVIAEPRLASEHIGGVFSRIRAALCRSASSILLVPASARSRNGPIVVAPVSARDPSLAVALHMARKADEDIVLFRSAAADDIADIVSEAAGAPGRVKVLDIAERSAPVIARTLAPIAARFLVLSRRGLSGDLEAALSEIASLARVPVLLVEDASTTTFG
jgi:hypothetical protein